jgi:Tol biopolymer transport system component/serine/threonine protein kinase
MTRTLGHYEVLDPLGAGGMGEVYRARDTRLGREVALKLLPERLSGDASSLARLEREARLLATLQHPNIAAVHDLDEQDGVRFLVMELVPGETLARRLERGSLGVAETLRVGTAVAEALAAAQEREIIHRDLKPGNIMLRPEGRVVVLDFGLAKIVPGADASGNPEISTLAQGATTHGMLVGTPAYMSPEQARGDALDPRTDVWSLGCVLFECLSGRVPFPGASPLETVAAILEREPDWSVLPPGLPPGILSLLRGCLDKDSRRRPPDAIQLRRILAGLAAPSAAPSPAPPSPGKGWFRTVSSRARAALSAMTGQSASSPPPGPLAPVHLQQLTFAEGVESEPRWSPDGTEILYCREVGGLRQLVRQETGAGESRLLTPGSHDCLQPCWSPDGRHLLYVRGRKPGLRLEPGDIFGAYQGGDIRILDLASGEDRLLVEDGFNPAYAPDGSRIAFDASLAGPRRIWVVDAHGRNPLQVTSDTSEEVDHLRPRWSPDGNRIVFQNVARTQFDIRALDMATRELTWISRDQVMDLTPTWCPTGRFIYFSSYRSGGINVWRVPLDAGGSPAGTRQQVTTGAGQDVEVDVHPGGGRLAFSILRQNADIWKLPVSPETGRPTGDPVKVLASSREDSRGAWSPDGSRIAFNSDRGGEMNLWVRDLTDGEERRITRGPGGDYQPNWSPDGNHLAFFSSRRHNPGIWAVEIVSGRLRALSPDGAIEINPFFSPDGSRIAYQSDREGRFEVWVMNADGSEPRPLTRIGVGGHFLRWSGDGRFILFNASGRGLHRVPAGGGEVEPLARISGGAHISLSPDEKHVMDVIGHRTLWVSPLGGGEPESIFVFSDPEIRIDYPVWSPDGRWVLFDRFRPQGGDVWILEGLGSS